MANTTMPELPPLPLYDLQPQPALIPFIPDTYLSLILPIIAYWAFSMFFHFIDTYDFFSRYRLHTPAEVLKRNRATRWEVVKDVLIQQALQTLVGVALAQLEEEQFIGKDAYNVAIWAQRVRLAQRFLPQLLSVAGVNAHALSKKAASSYPSLAGALNGGHYPNAFLSHQDKLVPTFTDWEMLTANAIYWVVVPAVQFACAIFIVDTYQYFFHRAMHMNKWLYTKFHSRHHRLYVPYAYGALYNHPAEGLFLDTLGTAIAYLLAGLSPRQGICFFTGTTIKTVDDHCGYAFPWDPLQHITSNNAGYHDIHHQSWGIKSNFSQPFSTVWDRLLGTKWTGGDVSAKYERSRLAAERKDAAASKQSTNNVESAVLSKTKLIAESAVSYDLRSSTRRYTRKKSISSVSPSTSAAGGSLKGLRDRVTSFHGRTGGVLGYESSI